MKQIFKTILEMFSLSDMGRKTPIRELGLREKIKGLFVAHGYLEGK